MTNYVRVIPRDLFNEAKLLKCLGQLYIESERSSGWLEIEHIDEGSGGGWEIVQNQDDGSISVANIMVTVYGEPVAMYTPLNAREAYPLYAQFGEADEVLVLTANGQLNDDFLVAALAQGVASVLTSKR